MFYENDQGIIHVTTYVLQSTKCNNLVRQLYPYIQSMTYAYLYNPWIVQHAIIGYKKFQITRCMLNKSSRRKGALNYTLELRLAFKLMKYDSLILMQMTYNNVIIVRHISMHVWFSFCCGFLTGLSWNNVTEREVN